MDSNERRVHAEDPSTPQAINMPFPDEFYGPELLRVVKGVMDDACAELREAGGDDGRVPRLMMSVKSWQPSRPGNAIQIA